MTAEQVLSIIKNLENDERWKLLSLLYDEYYRKSDIKISELEYDDE
jgi:hypothetical protein